MWHFILSLQAVPTDRDLIVAVLDGDSLYALEFPCRFHDGIWVDLRTGRSVEIAPTHWREWTEPAD